MVLHWLVKYSVGLLSMEHGPSTGTPTERRLADSSRWNCLNNRSDGIVLNATSGAIAGPGFASRPTALPLLLLASLFLLRARGC